MSQNINLFGPQFRRQRTAVSLKMLAGCLAVALVALAGYQAFLLQEVSGLDEELRSAQALLKVQQGYVGRLKGESTKRKPDSQLDAEIARLETELKQARESMDALKGGAIGTQQGFSEYLRAFSRQSLSGLWLTGVVIGGSGEIEIRGRAVSPDLVPGYIQRLNREKVLAGRSFARLEMTTPRPEAAAAAGGEKDADQAKAARKAPRYLDFSFATAEASKAEKTP
jgi:hypothetical protein